MSSMGSMGAADIVTAYLDALGGDDPDVPGWLAQVTGK